MIKMGDNVTEMDWATPEYLAKLTVEELAGALEAAGIGIIGVAYDSEDDRSISIAFDGIDSATRAVVMGVPSDEMLGSFCDRATASCITLSALAAEDVPGDSEEVENALDAGWVWTIHPDRAGDRAGWHVSVDMSQSDAQQLTANLNASRLAGA